MKLCFTCKQEKEFSEFWCQRNKKNNFQSSCKDCLRAYHKIHYIKNKKKYINNAKIRNKRRAQELRTILSNLKIQACLDCDKFYPAYVMDFDHRNPEEKLFNVSQYVAHGWGIKSLLAEIEKCDLVCSNCHRERTWGKK